jgi:hypothetical protein
MFPKTTNKFKKSKNSITNISYPSGVLDSTTAIAPSTGTFHAAKDIFWPRRKVNPVSTKPRRIAKDNLDSSRLASRDSSVGSSQPMSSSVLPLVSIKKHGLVCLTRTAIKRPFENSTKAIKKIFHIKDRVKLEYTSVSTVDQNGRQQDQWKGHQHMPIIAQNPRGHLLMSGFICNAGSCTECHTAQEDVDVSRVSEEAPQLDPVRISQLIAESPAAIHESITPITVRPNVDSSPFTSNFDGNVTPATSRFTNDSTSLSVNNGPHIFRAPNPNDDDSSLHHNHTDCSIGDVEDSRDSCTDEPTTQSLRLRYPRLESQWNLQEHFKTHRPPSSEQNELESSDSIEENEESSCNTDFEVSQQGLQAQRISLVRVTAKEANIRRKMPQDARKGTETVESLEDKEVSTDGDVMLDEGNGTRDAVAKILATGLTAIGGCKKPTVQQLVSRDQLDRQVNSQSHSGRASYETARETPSSASDKYDSDLQSPERLRDRVEAAFNLRDSPAVTPTIADATTAQDLLIPPTPSHLIVGMARLPSFLDLRSVCGLGNAPLLDHISNRIRDRFSHDTPKPVHSIRLLDSSPKKMLGANATAPYIAAIIRRARKSESHLITFDQFPFDILEGLVRAAVFGDEQCQELLHEIHEDCMRRLTSYTLKERRQIRLGYMMLDLYCLAYTQFTTWDVVHGIRKHFFHRATDSPRVGDKVFASFVHHAVRSNNLPKSSANQILLLLTACESDHESEVEKAVFEDRELFGPGGFIYTNNGRVVDRPQDISLYDELIHEEDLKDAPKTVAQAHKRVSSTVDELQKYIAGDQRPGAFGSEVSDESNEDLSLSRMIDDAIISLQDTPLLSSPANQDTVTSSSPPTSIDFSSPKNNDAAHEANSHAHSLES